MIRSFLLLFFFRLLMQLLLMHLELLLLMLQLELELFDLMFYQLNLLALLILFSLESLLPPFKLFLLLSQRFPLRLQFALLLIYVFHHTSILLLLFSTGALPFFPKLVLLFEKEFPFFLQDISFSGKQIFLPSQLILRRGFFVFSAATATTGYSSLANHR